MPQPPTCAQLRKTLDNQYAHRDLAYGFGITAGVLVAADVALFIVWPRKTPSLVAVPTSKGAMLGWRGQF